MHSLLTTTCPAPPRQGGTRHAPPRSDVASGLQVKECDDQSSRGLGSSPRRCDGNFRAGDRSRKLLSSGCLPRSRIDCLASPDHLLSFVADKGEHEPHCRAPQVKKKAECVNPYLGRRRRPFGREWRGRGTMTAGGRAGFPVRCRGRRTGRSREQIEVTASR